MEGSEMWSNNLSRAIAVCVIAAVSTVTIAGCGSADESKESKSVAAVSGIATPEGFGRAEVPQNRLAKKVAANPIPPGWKFEPKKCAPQSVDVSQDEVDSIETVVFRSTSTVITVVAHDARTDQGFAPSDECTTTAFSGPDGAGGFSVPLPVKDVSGADSVRGSHAILRDRVGSPTYDQYVFQAQVRGTIRVMVVVSPLLDRKPRARHVNPELGVGILRDAVQKLVAS